MSEQQYDIHKAAGIIIRDRRVLLARSKGNDVLVPPGGKLKPDEDSQTALARELKEEGGIVVDEKNMTFLGTFYAIAAGGSGKRLRMDVFLVDYPEGEINSQSEIEELVWTTSALPEGREIGSIFEHNIVPKLVARDLID